MTLRPSPARRCLQPPRVDLLSPAVIIERSRLPAGADTGPTRLAAGPGAREGAIHLAYPPLGRGSLGDGVALVRRRHPLVDPAPTSMDEVRDAVE